jgi:hypothetical protein
MVKLGDVTCFQHHADSKHASVPLYTTPPAVEPEPMRLYVEDFASRCGWEKDSGEGAFEYVQRKSYAQGLEDATPPAAQPEQVDCPRCGHVCSQRPWVGLTDEEIWEIHDRCIPHTEGYVFPVDFARAIEAAHNIKEQP